MLGIVESVVGVAGKVLDKFVEDKDLIIYPFFDGFFEDDIDTVLTQGYQIDSYPRIIQFKKEEVEEC